METDNIAISVLLAGYVPLGAAIGMLYADLRKARENEKTALKEGIELAQASVAETTSLSNVMSSIQRTVNTIDQSLTSFRTAMQDGFDGMRRHNVSLARAIARSVKASR